METIWIILSNSINGIALVVIMTVAVIGLNADRFKGEGVGFLPISPEQVSLWLILVGAFFQLSTLHDPMGTEWDLMILRIGMAGWMLTRIPKAVVSWLFK